jgi:lipopolysaccharide heptosyltransferase I
MAATAPRPANLERILLIRLGAVGDVLRTLPALHVIRHGFPESRITWVVEDLSRDLLVGHPEIDDVVLFPKRELRSLYRHPQRFFLQLLSVVRDLRRRRFTATLDFQGSLKSGLLARLSGAPLRVGYAPGYCREMSFLFSTHWVRPRGRSINRVEKNLALAEALGAPCDEITMALPERHEEGLEAEAILRGAAPAGGPVVLLMPGTSRLQAHKKWPVQHYARLAVLLRASLGAVPLVAWGPGEDDLAREVVWGSGGRAVMAPAAGLRVLAALLRRVAVFVGADTGPMHLAWGVGCRVVALFGPTDPRLNAPLGHGHVVLRGNGTMESIAPERVLEAVRGVLPAAIGPHGPAPAPRLTRADLAQAGLHPT